MRVPAENPFKCFFRDALKDPIEKIRYFPIAEDGTVIFILKEAKVPFQRDFMLFHEMSSREANNGVDCASDEQPNDGSPTFILRLSARRLRETSHHFVAMLQGHVSDKHEGSEFYEIKATGWNINALVALMSVVHGHSEFLCSDITLATLTDVAIIADHYSLSTAVSESTTLDLWLTQHSNSDRLFIGDDLNIEASLKRLAIACTFAKNRQQQELQLQQHLIGLLVRYTPRPLKGAGLPITATYITRLNESREKCLKVLLARFSDVLSYVLEKFEIGGWDCCVVCDGARSDRMVQMLHELGIRDVGEPAMELFSGYSLNLLSRYMEEDFEHPQSCEHLRQGRYPFPVRSVGDFCSPMLCHLPDDEELFLYVTGMAI